MSQAAARLSRVDNSITTRDDLTSRTRVCLLDEKAAERALINRGASKLCLSEITLAGDMPKSVIERKKKKKKKRKRKRKTVI